MFGKIKDFFTKNRKYYIKVKLNNQDVVFSDFSKLLSLLDGNANEVSVCSLSGDVQIIIGEK